MSEIENLEKRMRFPKMKWDAWKATTTVALVLFVVAGITAGYYAKKYNDIKKNPQKVAQDETKAVVASVSKLIQLPTGEDPTVATVTDLAPLKDQPFFANAKIGDKVLIYTNAKKAILYDPNTNKIIEVAPINLGANGTATVPAGTTPTTTTPTKTK